MTKENALNKIQTLKSQLLNISEYSSDDFYKWRIRSERYINDIFKDNIHYEKLSKVRFLHLGLMFGNRVSRNEEIEEFESGKKWAISILETFYEEVEEWKDEIIEVTIPKQIYSANNSNKVFIVHGHDELIITQVLELLRKLGLEPIILKDEANNGDTIIEKIERLSSEVGFGIVLYTACDIGGKDIDSLKPRARQNVVLEHGYLMARIGRKNTMALIKDKVEIPSDISGLLYTPIDEHKNWQYKLVDELKASGYDVSKDSI
ncbi:TIR domain-containing protein [Aliarcobacter cryaerophilus]|uniref:TIR domain-containing protein n=1 Tax=Aliarcobacter cryaerophilus TaxID=28198 RepID=UPI003DA52B00